MSYDGSIKIDTSINSKGLSDGLSKIASIAKGAFGAVTAAVTGAATVLGGLAAKSIQAGSSFEAGMSEVKAISGATGKELEALTEKAEEMGAKTKFSATESAEAMKYMAMAGWKTEDMLEGISGIMDLAAASGENLGSVSDIVTDALTAFGLQAKDSGHFADVLAKAASNSNTNVALMGATFKYAAPIAGALKYSIEDTAAAIGLMANAGIKGEQAGTALRSMLTRLVDPPKDAASALESLGVSATNVDGTVKPLRETIAELREKFSGLSDAEKTEYASNIAGQEAMSGLLAIVNAGDEDFEKLTAAIDDASGAASEQAGIMQDNLKGAMTELGSAAESLGITFYKSVQEPLKKIVKEAKSMVDGLNKAFKSQGMKGLIKEMGNIMAKVLKEVTNAAPKAIQAGKELIISFLKGIRENASSIADAAIEIGRSLLQAFGEIVPQIGQIGQEIITEFIRAIFGQELGDKAELLCNDVFDAFSGLSESLKSAAGDILEVISNVAYVLMDIAQAVLPVLTEAIKFLADNIDWLLPLLGGLAAGIGAFQAFSSIVGIIDGIKNSVLGIGAAIQAVNSLNVVGIILGVVAGVTALTVALSRASEAGNEYLVAAQRERKQAEENAEAMHQELEAYERASEARKKSNEGITAEYGQYQILFKELQSITDENGKIKEGYEERASVITGVLADALGIEIDTVDGVIQRYDKLKASIDELIMKKQAEAMLSANQSAYAEASQKQVDLFNAMAEAQDQVRESQKKLDEQNAISNSLVEEMERIGEDNIATQGKLGEAWKASQAAVAELETALQANETALADASKLYGENQAIIENYGALVAAVATGDMESMNAAIAAMSQNMRTAKNADKETLDNQLENYQNTYNAMKRAAEEGGIEISEEQMKQMEYLISATKGELGKLEQATADGMTRSGKSGASAFGATRYAYLDEAGNIVTGVDKEFGKNHLKDIGKASGSDYAKSMAGTAKENQDAAGEVKKTVEEELRDNQYAEIGEEGGDKHAEALGGTVQANANAAGEIVVAVEKDFGNHNYLQIGEDGGNDYADGIWSTIRQVSNAAREIRQGAENQLGNGSPSSLGWDFAAGFANGIENGSGMVGSAAGWLVDYALSTIRRRQNSNSPAKATMELGEDNSEGFAIGIKNKEKDVGKSAAGITETALAKIKEQVSKIGGIGGLVGRMKAAVANEMSRMSLGPIANNSAVVASMMPATANPVMPDTRPIYVETHVALGDETELAIALTPALRKELAFD